MSTLQPKSDLQSCPHIVQVKMRRRKRHLVCHGNKLVSRVTQILSSTYPIILTPNHGKPQQSKKEPYERLPSTRWDYPVDTISVHDVHVCFEFRPVHNVQHFLDIFTEYIEDLFCICTGGKTYWVWRFDELSELCFSTFYLFCYDAPAGRGFEDALAESYYLFTDGCKVMERVYGLSGG